MVNGELQFYLQFFHLTSSSWQSYMSSWISNFCNSFIYFLIVVLFFVFMPMALNTNIYNLFLVIRSQPTMNFCTPLWEFCAGYFFLLSFLLARTTTSSPTGSDDFILLLYLHIVHYLIKLWQKKKLQYGNVFWRTK